MSECHQTEFGGSWGEKQRCQHECVWDHCFKNSHHQVNFSFLFPVDFDLGQILNELEPSSLVVVEFLFYPIMDQFVLPLLHNFWLFKIICTESNIWEETAKDVFEKVVTFFILFESSSLMKKKYDWQTVKNCNIELKKKTKLAPDKSKCIPLESIVFFQKKSSNSKDTRQTFHSQIIHTPEIINQIKCLFLASLEIAIYHALSDME